MILCSFGIGFCLLVRLCFACIRRSKETPHRVQDAVAVAIYLGGRQVADIAVLVESLRIAGISIWDWNGNRAPVRRDEASQSVGVIARAEVVKPGFRVPFFAGKFVMIIEVVDELEFSAPGIIVRDRKSTRLNSSHQIISYAVFCLKKKKTQ